MARESHQLAWVGRGVTVPQAPVQRARKGSDALSKHTTSARHAPNRTLPLAGSASVAGASVIAHTASRRPRRTRGIPLAGMEARPESGNGKKECATPYSTFSFFVTLLGPSGPSLAGGLVESGSNSGSLVCRAARRQLRGPKAAARRQSCLRAWRRQQSGAVR